MHSKSQRSGKTDSFHEYLRGCLSFLNRKNMHHSNQFIKFINHKTSGITTITLTCENNLERIKSFQWFEQLILNYTMCSNSCVLILAVVTTLRLFLLVNLNWIIFQIKIFALIKRKAPNCFSQHIFFALWTTWDKRFYPFCMECKWWVFFLVRWVWKL